MSTRMDPNEDGLDRDGDDRRGGKGRGAVRKKLLPDEIFQKADYKNPRALRPCFTDRGKMVPRRITGASARQKRVISSALRRARMLALLPFSVTGD